jgi:hypothetical protein
MALERCVYCQEKLDVSDKRKGLRFCSDECEEYHYNEADEYDQDNGPTGHGDICMFDADTGL